MKPENGKYRHYRGTEYQVLGIVQHAETLEEMVLYKPVYGDNQLWVRPLRVFFEEVELEGVRQPRFRRID